MSKGYRYYRYDKAVKETPVTEPVVAAEAIPESEERYVAVVGVSLDKFKVHFRPGEEIPLEYLQDPDVAFAWLLKRKAIKAIGGN